MGVAYVSTEVNHIVVIGYVAKVLMTVLILRYDTRMNDCRWKFRSKIKKATYVQWFRRSIDVVSHLFVVNESLKVNRLTIQDKNLLQIFVTGCSHYCLRW